MLEEIKKEFNLFKLLVLLLTVAVSIYLLQTIWQFLGNFSDVIIIVIIAWLLSFILEPLVDLVENFTKLQKIWSALIVYVFFAVIFSLVVLVFLPVVITELQSLSLLGPKYLSAYPKIVRTWNNAVTNSVDTLINYIPSLATIFVDIILILVLSFYLIVDKEKINEEIYRLSPKSWHKNIKFVQKVIDDTFSSFLRIQVIFGILAGITTWIVLTLFSINLAASVSLVTGILTVIPLVGPFLGILPPTFVALATHPGNPLEAVFIFAVLLLIQQITFNALGPKLMGNAFKLHPIVVFLSIILGYKIAGPLGAVFVVPVLAICIVVLKELGHYFINPPQGSASE